MAGRAEALLLLLCFALSPSAGAQDTNPYAKFHRPPDIVNSRYGPHTRNVLDVWKADTLAPAPLLVYIHGGGFLSGDKTNLPPALLRQFLDAGIAVASINYRYTTDAPYPAPMLDGARAVQYLRENHERYYIDPKRVAAAGGSAGGGISLWLAYHDDLADPAASDDTAHRSTRLRCAVGVGAQSTYDPVVMERLVGAVILQHPGFEPFCGIKQPDWKTPAARRCFEDSSPVNHLSADDPPVLLLYDQPDAPLGTLSLNQAAHHPAFGEFLKEKAAKLRVTVKVVRLEDFTGAPLPQMYPKIVSFLREFCGF